MSNRPSAIILDVDGTLYEQGSVRVRMLARLVTRTLRHPLQMSTVWRVLAAYRRAQEAMRDNCHDSLNVAEEQLRLACRTARVPESWAACHVSYWMEEVPLDLLRPAMRPGVVEFLRTAKATGLRLAVWSDYPAVQKLEAMGVREFFDVVVCAQDEGVQRFKPDPRGLEQILSRLSLPKEAAFYVGDRPEVDGVAARRAGIRALIVGGKPHSNHEHWTSVKDFHDVLRRII